MTGCSCPERHLDPLGVNAELVFPWGGVLVLTLVFMWIQRVRETRAA